MTKPAVIGLAERRCVVKGRSAHCPLAEQQFSRSTGWNKSASVSDVHHANDSPQLHTRRHHFVGKRAGVSAAARAMLG